MLGCRSPSWTILFRRFTICVSSPLRSAASLFTTAGAAQWCLTISFHNSIGVLESHECARRPYGVVIELVTCLVGSAVAQQIESPPEEMSDEIGVTMRGLMRLLQPG